MSPETPVSVPQAAPTPVDPAALFATAARSPKAGARLGFVQILLALVIPALIVAVLVLHPGSAEAATGARVSVSGTARPGASITLVGSHFVPGTILQARWDSASTRLRIIYVNSRGGFRAGIRIPSTARPGAHTISLGRVSALAVARSGGTSSRRLIKTSTMLRVRITVPGAVSTPTPPVPTPPTGPPPSGCGSSLQGQINATPTGATLDVTGCSYSVSATVTIGRAMTVKGGSVVASTSALLITASNVTVTGMTIRGPGYGADHGHYAVYVHGSSAGSYISGDTIANNTITGWDGTGLLARFASGFTFSGNTLTNLWYAGIEAYSVKNGTISGNTVRNVIGKGNAYGIALTRAYGSLTTYPRTMDVTVSGNTIEDVPNWEALDTHGGQRLQIVNNTIRRARMAMMIGDSPSTAGGSPQYAPLSITVSGNVIESGVTNGSRDVGIYFFGANRGSGVLGSSREAATGVISGNTITGYGTQSGTDSGDIQVRDTSGLQVTGNRLIDGSPAGIQLSYNNANFSVSSNTIQDPWSNSLAYAYGIYVHSDYNTGTISGNSFVRGSKVANHVLTQNIVVLNPGHNHVTVQ